MVVGLGEALWDVLPDAAHFGGAPANVALHAAALGAESWLVSAVGQDARGDAALARLDGAGVRCDTVARLAAHPTGVVRVTIDAADGGLTFTYAPLGEKGPEAAAATADPAAAEPVD